jgi:hypothetical protein
MPIRFAGLNQRNDAIRYKADAEGSVFERRWLYHYELFRLAASLQTQRSEVR